MSIWLEAAQRIDGQTAACCAISDQCFDDSGCHSYEWHALYTKRVKEFARWFKPCSAANWEYWWPTEHVGINEEQQNIRVIALLLMHHITEDQG